MATQHEVDHLLKHLRIVAAQPGAADPMLASELMEALRSVQTSPVPLGQVIRTKLRATIDDSDIPRLRRTVAERVLTFMVRVGTGHIIMALHEEIEDGHRFDEDEE